MTLLLLLLACQDPEDACDGAFVTSTHFTPTPDGYLAGDCYLLVEDAAQQTAPTYDFSACCPAPYELVGVLSLDEVVCG
jgi:hypothetical protein